MTAAIWFFAFAVIVVASIAAAQRSDRKRTPYSRVRRWRKRKSLPTYITAYGRTFVKSTTIQIPICDN